MYTIFKLYNTVILGSTSKESYHGNDKFGRRLNLVCYEKIRECREIICINEI